MEVAQGMHVFRVKIFRGTTVSSLVIAPDAATAVKDAQSTIAGGARTVFSQPAAEEQITKECEDLGPVAT